MKRFVFTLFIGLLSFSLFSSHASYTRSKQTYNPSYFEKIAREKSALLAKDSRLSLIRRDEYGQEIFQLNLYAKPNFFSFHTRPMTQYLRESVLYLTQEGLRKSQVFFIN